MIDIWYQTEIGLPRQGPRGRPAGKPLTGFTLIELLLVVLIISITLGLSAPLFRKTFYGLELDLCAEDIAGYMRYIRERSIVEGVPMKFVLDAKEKEYWLEKKMSKAASMPESRVNTVVLP